MFPSARPRDETGGPSGGLPCSKIIRQPLWIILFIFLVMMVAIQMMSDGNKVQIPSNFPSKPLIKSNSKRLLDYCTNNDVSGSEGILPVGYSDLTLKHILITIRHGDRSAIHKMPGSFVAQTDNSQSKVHLRLEALQYASDMDSFNLVEILPQDSLSTRIINSTNAAAVVNSVKHRRKLTDVPSTTLTTLSSSHIFKRGDFELEQGQLTTKGFMQHIALGTFLRRQYVEFLSHQIRSPSNVYVRSTKYDRTFQSAAALLTTLLPLLGTSTQKVT
jgi:Histidine phosphatase superfamily (branch 2)